MPRHCAPNSEPEIGLRRAGRGARIAHRRNWKSASAAAVPEPAGGGHAHASAGSSASAFNPAISLVLAGNYADTSRDPEDWRIAGFMPNGGEIGPGERSFNLGESELTLAASVDPYFSAQLTAAITGEDEIEVEEAFFRTLALPAGFVAKGGRFFSGFGYLNEVHAHAWDFADQPLVYQAFFGNQRAQDGVQLKWIAPTDLFIELGAETGNGDAFPGTRERGQRPERRDALRACRRRPRRHRELAGRRCVDRPRGRGPRIRGHRMRLGEPVVNAFTGSSRTWVADAVFKWAPGRQFGAPLPEAPGRVHAPRRESGDLAFDLENAALVGLRTAARSPAGTCRASTSSAALARGPALRRARFRQSRRSGSSTSGALPAEAFPALLPGDPSRTTVMLDWNPSEFSRWRLQYAWDEARDDGDTDRQLSLQYLFGIGAHGAHKY